MKMLEKLVAMFLMMVAMVLGIAGGSTTGAMAATGLPLGTTASPGAPVPGQNPPAAAATPGPSPITGAQVAALQPQSLVSPPLEASGNVTTAAPAAPLTPTAGVTTTL